MKRVKKLLKAVGLVCLIALALCGIGIGGGAPILSHNRERYFDNTTKDEQVITKEKEKKGEALRKVKS